MAFNFQTLATKADQDWVKKVYTILSRSLPRRGNFVADATTRPFAHSTDDIEEIKNIQYDHTVAQRTKAGQKFMSLGEAHDRVAQNTRVHDGFWNPLSGVGSMDDPGMYNFAYIPVSMSPSEATSYYASGGIGAVIIDKKAKGCLINGYGFEGTGWEPDEVDRLIDYGNRVGFDVAVADSIRDGLIFGGAVAYPKLKQDNVISFEQSVKELLSAGVITKDCIEHFVTTDRWNTVIVPNWNVTARDYLNPSHYYIPIGGVKVATDRSAIVRPRMLPYWGMLPQIGWTTSDFEGYITSILSYRLVIMAIPIMAQQMSLLFHEIPLDGAIAQNGIEAVRELLASNDAVMRSWSVMHPNSVNSFGKIGAVERHYEGFDALVQLLQVDICANAELPQSVVFASQPTGLADSNEEDVALKQAESVKKITVSVAPQFKKLSRILAMSCFGPEYFAGAEGKIKLETLKLTFNPPVVQSNDQRADAGAKFADTVGKLVSAQMPLDAAIELSQQFFPDIEIPDEIMNRIKMIPETENAPNYADVMSQGGLAEKLAGGEHLQVMRKGKLIEKLGGDENVRQVLQSEGGGQKLLEFIAKGA